MQKLLGYAAAAMIMAVIAAIWIISNRTPWPSADAARTEALCVEQISPSLPGSESFRQKADCAKAAGNELDAVAYRHIAKSYEAAEVKAATANADATRK